MGADYSPGAAAPEKEKPRHLSRGAGASVAALLPECGDYRLREARVPMVPDWFDWQLTRVLSGAGPGEAVTMAKPPAVSMGPEPIRVAAVGAVAVPTQQVMRDWVRAALNQLVLPRTFQVRLAVV